MAKKSNKILDKQGYGDEVPVGTNYIENPQARRWARSWYAYHLSMDNIVKWVKKWAKDENDTAVLALIEKMDKNYVVPAFGQYCRQLTRKCVFPTHSMDHFRALRAEFLKYAPKHQKVSASDEEKARSARQKAAKHEAAMQLASDEIEELQWRCIEKRGKHGFSAKSLKARHGLSDDDMKTLVSELKPLIDELHELVFKKTADLREGYSHIKNHKGYYTIMHEIYNDIVFESTAKKAANRTKRAKKAPAADKVVKSIRFQAEDKDLKLRSLHPVEIVGAPKIWVYSTKYREIMCFTAKAGGFSAKGASLINVAKGEKKKLRKPEQDVGKFTKGSSISRDKAWKALTTKAGECSFRFAPHYLILKVEK